MENKLKIINLREVMKFVFIIIIFSNYHLINNNQNLKMRSFEVITVFVSTASAHCAAGVENDLMRTEKSIDFVGMPWIVCGDPTYYDDIDGKNDKFLVNAGLGSLGHGKSCQRGATGVSDIT